MKPDALILHLTAVYYKLLFIIVKLYHVSESLKIASSVVDLCLVDFCFLIQGFSV